MTIRRFSFLLFWLMLSGSTAWCASRPVHALQQQLGIPALTADVGDRYWPDATHLPKFVLIEDMHSHPEAQGKIAAILLYAHHRWHSRAVFIEGAFAEVGPPPFPMFSPERGERSANELLQYGRLTGAELAAALTSVDTHPAKNQLRVFGMDEKTLYAKQLQAYDLVNEMRPKALRHLRQYGGGRPEQEISLTRQLLQLRLSPTDYDRYTHLHRIWHDPTLFRAIAAAQSYYELTYARSDMFLKRATAVKLSAPCLMVMGGFHAPAVAKALKRRGLSYVVLVPRITQQAPALAYYNSMRESSEKFWQLSTKGHIYSAVAQRLHLSLEHKEQNLDI